MTDGAAIAAPGLRRIVTPEGVALGVTLADRGTRAAAFVVDMLLIACDSKPIRFSTRFCGDHKKPRKG